MLFRQEAINILVELWIILWAKIYIYYRFDIVQTLAYKSERDRRLFIRQQRILYEHYHTLYKICHDNNDFSDKYIYPHFLYIHVMENNILYTLKNPSSQKKEYF